MPRPSDAIDARIRVIRCGEEMADDLAVAPALTAAVALVRAFGGDYGRS